MFYFCLLLCNQFTFSFLLLQSQASPHQTMTDVLKVLHGLNVHWKRIGHFNMKCLWERPRSKYSRGIFINGCPQTTPDGDQILPSSTSGAGVTIRTHDSVKFEFQVRESALSLRSFYKIYIYMCVCACVVCIFVWLDASFLAFLQLYKATGEMYVVDMQWLNGPPFLFLELCASFLSVVGII